MKISKQSQTYRFIERWSDEQIPTNLCPYVRKLLIVLMTYSSIAFFVGLFAIMPAIIVPYMWIDYWFFGGVVVDADPDGLVPVWIMLFYIELAIVAMVGVVYLMTRPTFKRIKAQYFSPLVTTTDWAERSLLVQWIKAKHDKICPKLEFTE